MKLDTYMKRNHLTASDFGRKIGTSAWTIERYLKGRIPNPEMFRAIFEGTEGKVKPNDFFDFVAKHN